MKKKRWIRVWIGALLAVMGTVLFGCTHEAGPIESPAESVPEPVFQVFLAEDPENYEIVSENPVTVRRGEEAAFTLRMKDGACVLQITRQNAAVEAQIRNEFDKTTSVRLPDIRYSAVYQTECGSAEAYLAYDPNGGRYIDQPEGSEADGAYTVGVSLQSRLRPNTERGTDRFVREGYVLTGWNTEPDGSGEAVGLGSRVTVEAGSPLTLYAQWAKESSADDFIFDKYGKGWTVVRYTGSEETVVLPQYYEGRPVDRIAKGAFAENQTIKYVILPPTLEVVAPGAFAGSPLETLTLFDNIRTISDSAFENCGAFSTVHVNAYEAPRFGQNLFSEYNLADKYDLLILNQDKRKLIIFGGSGAYNSVDALALEKQLKTAGEEYLCLNMAVNGWFNGPAQMEAVRTYLKDGDVFLHMPETSSGFSTLYNISMTPGTLEFEYNRLRFYACAESNYDLLSLFDLRDVTGFFDGLQAINEERDTLPEVSFTDHKTEIDWYGGFIHNDLGYMDERGYLALPKKAGSSKSAGEADLVVEYLTDEAANDRLNAYYDSLSARGVRVLFACAAVNADTLEARLNDPESFQRPSDDGVLYYGRPAEIALPDYESLSEWIGIYEKTAEDLLHAEILLPLSGSLFRTGDFFEPDYHLSDEAAPVFTARIGEALLRVLKGGEAK